MQREIDWSKWRRTPRGYVRVPPPACPRGHRWTLSGPGRPAERFVTCRCTLTRHHAVWVCPTCHSYCAEGCRDVSLWTGHTVPVGVGPERRAAI